MFFQGPERNEALPVSVSLAAPRLVSLLRTPSEGRERSPQPLIG